MLTKYTALQLEENHRKYYRMGFNAKLHGLDRKVADDLAVGCRESFREGWDKARVERDPDALLGPLAGLFLDRKRRLNQ